MGFKNILIMVLAISLFSSFVAASTCQGAWGDDSSTYPVPTSFSQFSDSDTVGLNCHLSGSQCPVPQIEGTCDAANQGFMRCNIEVRDSSGTWTSIAQSTAGEHCDFNDDTGSNFATVSNFMIDHDDVTDIRCKAYALSYDSTFDLCVVSAKGHDKRDDWWYNENTPTANSVVINPSGANTLDDLDCDYTFSDADNDTENTSAAQYKWYINDIDMGVNSATLGNNSTDVSDIVVCSVKVFDDVFVTGNEAFVNSSPVNITDTIQPPGTLPQRREMSLEFTDKVETSYVMIAGNRIVEISGDEKLYLHNDNIGSSSLKTDENGKIDSEIIRMPFGATKADTGDGSSKSFYTGKETDNTGLQYFGSRYYDPISGRFTQIDPVQRNSVSNYYYADANPMKYIDPDGNLPVIPPLVGALIGWAIGEATFGARELNTGEDETMYMINEYESGRSKGGKYYVPIYESIDAQKREEAIDLALEVGFTVVGGLGGSGMSKVAGKIGSEVADATSALRRFVLSRRAMKPGKFAELFVEGTSKQYSMSNEMRKKLEESLVDLAERKFGKNGKIKLEDVLDLYEAVDEDEVVSKILDDIISVHDYGLPVDQIDEVIRKGYKPIPKENYPKLIDALPRNSPN